jgi:hypothetical protein
MKILKKNPKNDENLKLIMNFNEIYLKAPKDLGRDIGNARTKLNNAVHTTVPLYNVLPSLS